MVSGYPSRCKWFFFFWPFLLWPIKLVEQLAHPLLFISFLSLFLQTIKSRLQSAPQGTYTGFMDCARKLIAQDGVTALWKGFGPAMARAVPANVSRICNLMPGRGGGRGGLRKCGKLILNVLLGCNVLGRRVKFEDDGQVVVNKKKRATVVNKRWARAIMHNV